MQENFTDATLACGGKFYPVHRLVLSSCSEYFEDMFEQAARVQCKHPFIVLKDITSDEIESLLSYMYVGEVNVVQEKLGGLIKAAECLRIKGLAVPDEEPGKSSREKRVGDTSINSEPKRRKTIDTSIPNHSESGGGGESKCNNSSEKKPEINCNSNKFSSSNSTPTKISSIENKESTIPRRLSENLALKQEDTADQHNDIDDVVSL